MLNEEHNRIDEEYKKVIKGLKLEFGNPTHFKIYNQTKELAKLEKRGTGKKNMENMLNIKKSIIYLNKLDF